MTVRFSLSAMMIAGYEFPSEASLGLKLDLEGLALEFEEVEGGGREWD